MLQIKFANETEKHTITHFRIVDENVVCMGFDSVNTSGFETFIDDDKVGDFLEYTTIYRKLYDYTYYSKDGSVFVEPTTEIKAIFDGESPDKVEVQTSFGEIVVLEKPLYTSMVKGEYVNIVEAEQLDDYNTELNGSIVYYSTKSEGQKEKEKHAKGVSEQTLRLADMFINMGINGDDFLDRIDAQLLYTALMTDTLVEEEL